MYFHEAALKNVGTYAPYFGALVAVTFFRERKRQLSEIYMFIMTGGGRRGVYLARSIMMSLLLCTNLVMESASRGAFWMRARS